jgi:hypothetical protein
MVMTASSVGLVLASRANYIIPCCSDEMHPIRAPLFAKRLVSDDILLVLRVPGHQQQNRPERN